MDFQIAILITCCLTSVIVSIATRTIFTDGQEGEYPYSLMYEGNLNNKVVEEALNLSKEKVNFKLETHILSMKVNSNSKNIGQIPYIDEVDLISYSQVKKIAEYRELDNENKFLKANLKDDEAIFIIPKAMINAFNFKVNLNLGHENIKITDAYAMNLFGKIRQDESTIIVNLFISK